MDTINLNSFLRLGFFLSYRNPKYSINLSNVNKELYRNFSEVDLIDKGVELLRTSISANFATNKTHAVPISGGLDSRFILAGLLEHTDARNIHTYTFGTPKTWDYEIGNSLAKKIGTHHRSFDLTKHSHHIDELIDISKRIDHQTVLFHHPPVHEINERFANHVIWSGLLAGPIAGGHLPPVPALDIEDAKRSFIKKNTLVKSVDLARCPNNAFFGLIEGNELSGENLCLEEQFSFVNRQLKYIFPHVLWKGLNYRIPFSHHELLNFMLSIPDRYRYGKYLYKKLLLKAFPRCSRFATKENHGLPLDSNRFSVFGRRIFFGLRRRISKTLFIDPRINYINFNPAIRERSDLQKIVYDNLMDLKERKILDWIDFEQIWKAHMARKANHADALLVLTSLEIHLKAGKVLA